MRILVLSSFEWEWSYRFRNDYVGAIICVLFALCLSLVGVSVVAIRHSIINECKELWEKGLQRNYPIGTECRFLPLVWWYF